jgi:hypothetical protein
LRSPCSTCTVTAVWLSSAVEKICEALVGIVVFFSISLVNTPPMVSMPSDSGVTSSSSTSLTAPESTPPCIAAPMATASSGLTSLRGSLPKNSVTASCTLGMRVMPPTRITSAISDTLESRIGKRRAAGIDGALDQVIDQRFELGARQAHVQMLRTTRVGRDEGQVDVGLLRELSSILARSAAVLAALQRERVLAQVDAVLLLELVDEVVDDALVEVFAAEEGIAIGRQHFELLLAVDFGDFNDRDVEGAAAEVVDRDLAILAALLVEAIGQRGRGRLVDDALDFETGDAAGILGRLALASLK